ncbi:unnamed protein product [Lactuca saligna]|uniref:GRF-type domain-containing protein n=1 Tax=Lactuca saligna TaxID=75948 RepID=A0AA35YWY4_LACSI|nr:unnamed protein product [Lactuca saligna]CAI9281392.1 unnamed protein product [Lactuca saligna]
MSSSSSSSISSKRNVEFQPENPCYCGLPSRVRTSRTKDNPGKKFRLCPNSMNEGPKCKFWEWLEPETPENEVNSGKDKKEPCNLTLKVSILENEISICKMKMEQENLVVRQEFEKLKWKLFTHKVVMIVLFLLFVFKK